MIILSIIAVFCLGFALGMWFRARVTNHTLQRLYDGWREIDEAFYVDNSKN